MSDKREFYVFKILDLWFYNEKEWIRFKDIKDKTGIAERSLARYLNQLVADRVLDKDKEKRYRPIQGSLEERIVRALRFARARKNWETMDTAEKELEIARRIFKAYLGSAEEEITEVALQFIEGKHERITVDEELFRLWIDSFLTDFKEQLRRVQRYSNDIFVKEYRREKYDAVDLARQFASSFSEILRSYADLSLKLYRDAKPITLTRENGTKIRVPSPIGKEIREYVNQGISRGAVEELKKQKYDDYVNKGIPKMLTDEILKDNIWIPTHSIKVFSDRKLQRKFR